MRILELQYGDDYALVSHRPEALRAVLTAAEGAYCRMVIC